MRRAITIIILTAMLLSLGIFELFSVNNIITKLDNKVDNLIPVYENNQEGITIAYDSIQKIKSEWEKDEYGLALMFNHKDLSMVNDSLCRLTAYTKNNDYDNAIAEVYLLKEYTEKNTDIMGFNFQNIF